MGKNLLTYNIELALLKYLKFKYHYIASTEVLCHYGIADVIFIKDFKKEKVIYGEIEIKTSMTDLINEQRQMENKYINLSGELSHGKLKYTSDNKWLKHTAYFNGDNFMPNLYYFCFTKDILELGLKYSEQLNSKYGVLLYDNNQISNIKKPVKLNTDLKHKPNLDYEILRRLSNHNIYLMEERYGSK